MKTKISEGKVIQITVAFPKEVFDIIFQDATKKQRSVGGQIRFILIEHYKDLGKLS